MSVEMLLEVKKSILVFWVNKNAAIWMTTQKIDVPFFGTVIMFPQLKMIVSTAVASLSQEPPTITFCHLFGLGNLRDLFWVIVLITPRDGKSTSHFGTAKAARISLEMRQGHLRCSSSAPVLSLHLREEMLLKELSSYLNVSIPTSRTPHLDEGLQGGLTEAFRVAVKCSLCHMICGERQGQGSRWRMLA